MKLLSRFPKLFNPAVVVPVVFVVVVLTALLAVAFLAPHTWASDQKVTKDAKAKTEKQEQQEKIQARTQPTGPSTQVPKPSDSWHPLLLAGLLGFGLSTVTWLLAYCCSSQRSDNRPRTGTSEQAAQKPSRQEILQELRAVRADVEQLKTNVEGLTEFLDRMKEPQSKQDQTIEDFKSRLKVLEPPTGTANPNVFQELKRLREQVITLNNDIQDIQQRVKDIVFTEVRTLTQSIEDRLKSKIDRLSEDTRTFFDSLANVEKQLGEVEQRILSQISPYVFERALPAEERLQAVRTKFKERSASFSALGQPLAQKLDQQMELLLNFYSELPKRSEEIPSLERFLDRVDRQVFFPEKPLLSRIQLPERERQELSWVEKEVEAFRDHLKVELERTVRLKPLEVVPYRDKFNPKMHVSNDNHWYATKKEPENNLIVRVIENGYLLDGELKRKATVERLLYRRETEKREPVTHESSSPRPEDAQTVQSSAPQRLTPVESGLGKSVGEPKPATEAEDIPLVSEQKETDVAAHVSEQDDTSDLEGKLDHVSGGEVLGTAGDAGYPLEETGQTSASDSVEIRGEKRDPQESAS